MNRIGRKIATLVSIDASNAGSTSDAPATVADQASLPCSMNRSTLPCTISAASMTMPVENARPASETTLSVRPSRCIVITAKNSESGIDAAITSSARDPRPDVLTAKRHSGSGNCRRRRPAARLRPAVMAAAC